MNKNDKRKNSLRNKLFAAIAMLLVSSIMMVSTTYAWFTLSTAPEVQGITTTVGANGNLEIALSPYTGDADDIGSGTEASNLPWVEKNLTWGNLLDLSSASYGLGDIKLMPAQLNALQDILQPSPLATPVYGADGRIDTLERTSAIGTKLKLDDNGTTIIPATDYTINDYKGVRVIGTYTSDSKYAITFNNYLSAMGIAAAEAQSLAEQSLTANGAKLAEMAIAHASAADPDTTNYAEYVPYMVDVIETLQASNDKIADALYDAVVAAGASTLSDAAKYATLMNMVENNATLEELMTYLAMADNDILVAYEYWESIEDSLANAETALSDAKTKADAGNPVLWSDTESTLNVLLTTTGMTFNEGKTFADFRTYASKYMDYTENGAPKRENYGSDDEFNEAYAEYEEVTRYMGNCATNMQIRLSYGSGIYPDIAAMVGDLSANVRISIIYGGLTLPNIPVTISTTTGGTSGALGAARDYLRGLGAYTDDTAQQDTITVLSDRYAYMVDFLFRTNASNSKLMLQTSAAQRVYEDGSSQATLGGGSTMSFRTGALDAQAVQKLMGAIRVVFLDTNSNAIYGYAKLDMASVRETEISAVQGETPAVLEYTADLYLYESSDNGLNLTTKIDEENAELCDLPANTAKAVSAMVYLDGNHVDNSMVANGTTSMTGSLNLQFASSEPLKPMENSDLENMTVSTEATTEPTEPSVDTTEPSVDTTESSVDTTEDPGNG